ncbi:MAG: hypothetical protein ACUVT5_00825 [Candidatus Bathyarchaeales archaeon]
MLGRNNRGCSGQIVAISALVIALIMTSTAMYIYELSGNISDTDAYLLNDYVGLIKLGSKHVVIGALANITNGGQNQTLAANLNRWKAVVGQLYSLGTFALDFTLLMVAPYSSGLYVSWGTEGSGISEAYADLQLNITGKEVKVQYPFHVNVSTRLYVEGFLTQITPLTKQATVTVHLFNEEQPALAKNITIYYRELVLWVKPDDTSNYVLTDYGNGTYRATFTLITLADSIDVSARVFDTRNILVQANATISQQ